MNEPELTAFVDGAISEDKLFEAICQYRKFRVESKQNDIGKKKEAIDLTQKGANIQETKVEQRKEKIAGLQKDVNTNWNRVTPWSLSFDLALDENLSQENSTDPDKKAYIEQLTLCNSYLETEENSLNATLMELETLKNELEEELKIDRQNREILKAAHLLSDKEIEDKMTVLATKKVNAAKTGEELCRLIDQIGVIRPSERRQPHTDINIVPRQEPYDIGYLKGKISDFIIKGGKNGGVPLESLPRAYGIRNQVKRLWENSLNENETIKSQLLDDSSNRSYPGMGR